MLIQATPSTSTTLPQGCASGPTFASVRCRVASLGPVVSAAATEPVRGRLGRLLERTGELLVDAEASQAAGRTGPAKKALRRSNARLRRFGKKVLAPKSGLADPTRAALAEQAEALGGDLRLLRDSL